MRFIGKLLKALALCILSILLAGGVYLLCNDYRNQSFVTTFYQLQTDQEISDLRIVLLADLHLREFGEDNADLVKKIADLQPDLIALAGDMNIDTDPNYEPIITLLNQLTKIAPTYYVPGNHEWTGAYHYKHMDMLEAIRETDAVYMENSFQRVTIGENELMIGGVYSYADTVLEGKSGEMMKNFCDEDGFHLLLCHFPEVFIEALADYPVDLALCGHAHGGQIRLPGTDGLWSENQGWFPEYTSGLREMSGSMVCISRGLGDDHRIPRINNQPELVTIDVN